MPFLSESVNEGTVSWQAQLGEMVYEGDWLLDVSTNKVDMTVDSPVAGVLIEICVADDETAQVGETLGVIGPAGSAPLTVE
ncbi:lipoyl domain-containing protein [Streptomyces bobili]|uniref:Lipoyl-binding domain-containing protein n=1 Tax=Streptomyces bobili TaxID=67280 RepID=A0ABZ1RCA4_9ACTN|nr:biotin/lipoyl-containing protein [Streptomyces bobili]